MDATEKVEFGELHVFAARNFVVTVRHAETPDLARSGGGSRAIRSCSRHGPEAVLYAIIDQVVDEYAPVVAGSRRTSTRSRTALRGEPDGLPPHLGLTREVIEFQRAVPPLPAMIAAAPARLEKTAVNSELRRNLRDVEDHVERLISLADCFLTSSRTRSPGTERDAKRQNEASAEQNEQVKKVSSWAAILFAPSSWRAFTA